MGPSPDNSLSRRQVLGLGAAAVAATILNPAEVGATNRIVTQGAEALRPTIRARSDWAGGLGVKGELVREEDVRFLLVHHTASSNAYDPGDVPGLLRGFYEFHTGPDKGWPDVAYNFFVDRYGTIWEGREGSIAAPIRGDATGGSQGFALLCSLVGNHHEAPVTAEQQAGLVQLLAWLGETYAVDTDPGALTTFVSRGSSRWPAGAEVTTSTISGHRDMSTTTCPGDFAYPLLATEIPTQVSALRPVSATTSTPTTATPETDPSAPSTAATATTSATAVPPSDTATASTGESVAAAPTIGTETVPDTGDGAPWPVVGGVIAAAAAGAALFSRLWKRADVD